MVKGCVNLPERTGMDLITGTDPLKVGFVIFTLIILLFFS